MQLTHEKKYFKNPYLHNNFDWSILIIAEKSNSYHMIVQWCL